MQLIAQTSNRMLLWSLPIIGLAITSAQAKRDWPITNKNDGYTVRVVSQEPLIYKLELPNSSPQFTSKRSSTDKFNRFLDPGLNGKKLTKKVVRKRRCHNQNHNHGAHLQMKRSQLSAAEQQDNVRDLLTESPALRDVTNFMEENSPYDYQLLNNADRPISRSDKRSTRLEDPNGGVNPVTHKNHVTPRAAPPMIDNSAEEYKVIDISKPGVPKDYDTLKEYLRTIHERQMESHKLYQSRYQEKLKVKKPSTYYSSESPRRGYDRYSEDDNTKTVHGENYIADDVNNNKGNNDYLYALTSQYKMGPKTEESSPIEHPQLPPEVHEYLDPKKLYYEALNSLLAKEKPDVSNSSKPEISSSGLSEAEKFHKNQPFPPKEVENVQSEQLQPVIKNGETPVSVSPQHGGTQSPPAANLAKYQLPPPMPDDIVESHPIIANYHLESRFLNHGGVETGPNQGVPTNQHNQTMNLPTMSEINPEHPNNQYHGRINSLATKMAPDLYRYYADSMPQNQNLIQATSSAVPNMGVQIDQQKERLSPPVSGTGLTLGAPSYLQEARTNLPANRIPAEPMAVSIDEKVAQHSPTTPGELNLGVHSYLPQEQVNTTGSISPDFKIRMPIDQPTAQLSSSKTNTEINSGVPIYPHEPKTNIQGNRIPADRNMGVPNYQQKGAESDPGLVSYQQEPKTHIQGISAEPNERLTNNQHLVRNTGANLVSPELLNYGIESMVKSNFGNKVSASEAFMHPNLAHYQQQRAGIDTAPKENYEIKIKGTAQEKRMLGNFPSHPFEAELEPAAKDFHKVTQTNNPNLESEHNSEKLSMQPVPQINFPHTQTSNKPQQPGVAANSNFRAPSNSEASSINFSKTGAAESNFQPQITKPNYPNTAGGPNFQTSQNYYQYQNQFPNPQLGSNFHTSNFQQTLTSFPSTAEVASSNIQEPSIPETKYPGSEKTSDSDTSTDDASVLNVRPSTIHKQHTNFADAEMGPGQKIDVPTVQQINYPGPDVVARTKKNQNLQASTIIQKLPTNFPDLQIPQTNTAAKSNPVLPNYPLVEQSVPVTQNFQQAYSAAPTHNQNPFVQSVPTQPQYLQGTQANPGIFGISSVEQHNPTLSNLQQLSQINYLNTVGQPNIPVSILQQYPYETEQSARSNLGTPVPEGKNSAQSILADSSIPKVSQISLPGIDVTQEPHCETHSFHQNPRTQSEINHEQSNFQQVPNLTVTEAAAQSNPEVSNSEPNPNYFSAKKAEHQGPVMPENLGNTGDKPQLKPGAFQFRTSKLMKFQKPKNSEISVQKNIPNHMATSEKIQQESYLTPKEIEHYELQHQNISLMDHIPAEIKEKTSFPFEIQNLLGPDTLVSSSQFNNLSSNTHHESSPPKTQKTIYTSETDDKIKNIPEEEGNKTQNGGLVEIVQKSIEPATTGAVYQPMSTDFEKTLPTNKNHHVLSSARIRNIAKTSVADEVQDQTHQVKQLKNEHQGKVSDFDSGNEPLQQKQELTPINTQPLPSNLENGHEFKTAIQMSEANKTMILPSGPIITSNPIPAEAYKETNNQTYGAKDSKEMVQPTIIEKTAKVNPFLKLRESNRYLARNNKETKNKRLREKPTRKYATRTSAIPIQVQKVLLHILPKDQKRVVTGKQFGGTNNGDAYLETSTKTLDATDLKQEVNEHNIKSKVPEHNGVQENRTNGEKETEIHIDQKEYSKLKDNVPNIVYNDATQIGDTNTEQINLTAPPQHESRMPSTIPQIEQKLPHVVLETSKSDSMAKTVANEITELQKAYLENIPPNVFNREYGFYNVPSTEKVPYDVILEEKKADSSEVDDKKSKAEYSIKYLQEHTKTAEPYHVVIEKPNKSTQTTLATTERIDYDLVLDGENSSDGDEKIANIVSLIRSLSKKNETDNIGEENPEIFATPEEPKDAEGRNSRKPKLIHVPRAKIEENVKDSVSAVKSSSDNLKDTENETKLSKHLILDNAQFEDHNFQENPKFGNDYTTEPILEQSKPAVNVSQISKLKETPLKSSIPTRTNPQLDTIMDHLKKLVIPFDPKGPRRILIVDPNKFNQKVIEVPVKTNSEAPIQKEEDPFYNDELARSSPDNDSNEDDEDSYEDEEEEDDDDGVQSSKAIPSLPKNEKNMETKNQPLVQPVKFPNIKEHIKWMKYPNSRVGSGNYDRFIKQRDVTPLPESSQTDDLVKQSNPFSDLQLRLAQQQEERKKAAENKSRAFKERVKMSTLKGYPNLNHTVETSVQQEDSNSNMKAEDTGYPLGAVQFQNPEAPAVDTTDPAAFLGYSPVSTPENLQSVKTGEASVNDEETLRASNQNNPAEHLEKRSCSCGNHNGANIGNTCSCALKASQNELVNDKNKVLNNKTQFLNNKNEHFIKDTNVSSNTYHNSQVFKDIQSRIANQRKRFSDIKNGNFSKPIPAIGKSNIIKTNDSLILEKGKKVSKCKSCEECSSESEESREFKLGSKIEDCGCKHEEIKLVKVSSDKLKALKPDHLGCGCGKDSGGLCNHNELLRAASPPKDDPNKYDILSNTLLWLKQYAPKTENSNVKTKSKH